MQRPNGTALGFVFGFWIGDQRGQWRHDGFIHFHDALQHARMDFGAAIGEEIGEGVEGYIFPFQKRAEWVAYFDRTFFANAIDATLVFGPRDAREGALVNIPAAGVDDDKAAIGRFEHVGWMKVGVG